MTNEELESELKSLRRELASAGEIIHEFVQVDREASERNSYHQWKLNAKFLVLQDQLYALAEKLGVDRHQLEAECENTWKKLLAKHLRDLEDKDAGLAAQVAAMSEDDLDSAE